MGLKDLLKKSFVKSEEFKEMEKDLRMRKMLEQRQKSSNERELERFQEERREEQIKKELEGFRKRKKEEFFMHNDMLKQKNIFKGHKSILHQDNSILDGGKKLFSGKSTMLKGGMFFK